jgi:hypothetical protein
MVLVDGIPQAGSHDMRVHLSGGNIRVAQHGLYAPQVRAAFQQMGSEAVPQHVGR